MCSRFLHIVVCIHKKDSIPFLWLNNTSFIYCSLTYEAVHLSLRPCTSCVLLSRGLREGLSFSGGCLAFLGCGSHFPPCLTAALHCVWVSNRGLTASPPLQAQLGMRKWWDLEFHHGLVGFLWVLRGLGCCFGLQMNLCMAFTIWFWEAPGLKNPGSSLGAGKDWGAVFLHHFWFWPCRGCWCWHSLLKGTGKRATVCLEVPLIFLILPSLVFPKQKCLKNQKRLSAKLFKKWEFF